MMLMSKKRLAPNLRFSGFDGEWNETTLSDIATFSKGKGISKKDISDDGIECVRYGELYTKYTEMIYNVDSKTNLDENELQLSEKYDILIPCSGETAIDLATASCIQKDQVAIGGDITIIKTNQYAPFITYYLNQKKTEIAKYAQGVSIVHLYPKDFNVLNIKIPLIKEQKKIVHILEKISYKEQLLEKKLKFYQDFKKYLMQQIFTQKLRFDFNEDWYIDKIGNNSEVFGRIGFRGYTVDDLVDKGQGALTIGGKHISKNFQLDLSDPEYLSWEKYEESPEIKIYNDDVLLVKTASVGKVCFIENLNEPATLNPQLIVFKNIKLNNKFFYYYLTSNLFQKDIHKIKSTTGIPTITQKELLNLNIIYPSLEEQEKIVNFLSIVDKKISSIDKNLKDIEKFKNGLLQQMFI